MPSSSVVATPAITMADPVQPQARFGPNDDAVLVSPKNLPVGMWVEPGSSAEVFRSGHIAAFGQWLMYCRVTHYKETRPPSTVVDLELSASGDVLAARPRDPTSPFARCIAKTFVQEYFRPDPHAEIPKLRITVSYW